MGFFLGMNRKARMDKKRTYHFQIVGLFVAAVICLFIVKGGTTKKVKYGIMFDAGSTGSRIHVYSFDADTGKLLNEVFEEVKPGLSGYKNPKEAAASLQPLMDIAVKKIPPNMHKCTPLALKATAGLRLLGRSVADQYLAAVRQFFENYSFHIEPNGVAIMEGSEEGVFAWITVNYLLGKLNGPHSEGAKTVSIMDLGGGSTQIVFEPKANYLESSPDSYKYVLKYGENKYTLYQHSYEPYGLMRARQLLLKDGITDRGNTMVSHPCIPTGHKELVELDGEKYNLVPSETRDKYDGPALFQKCIAHAKKILHKEKSCPISLCSFNGVFQPSIGDRDVFAGDMYAFSYFFDRTQLDGSHPELTVGDIRKMGETACASNASDAKHGVLCTDLSYIYTLLTEGYSLKESHVLKIAKKIDGYETAWALGAMVTLLKNTRLEACDVKK